MNLEIQQIEKKILNLAEEYFFEKNKNNYFVPYVSKIPVTGKVLDADDLKNLISSSLDMWLTSGRFTEEFEKSISKYLNIRHTLFVNSGSSANLLALSALKILYNLKDGDEVITCAVNFPTTLNPIIQNNLKPVFIDANIESYNIDHTLIESKLTNRTKGIVLAHTLGNPFNIQEIKKICDKHNLFLMEDMCDAFGSKYNDKFVGTFGEVASLSFYPAHHITTGEGGAVLTNNPKLKKIIESLRDWGRDCYCPPGKDNTCRKRYDWQLGGLPQGYDHKYTYSHIGYNLKSSDMQAAIGLSQMKKLDKFIQIRKSNFNFLYEKFKNFEDFLLPSIEESSEPSWFGFPLTIKNDSKIIRKHLLEHYENEGIGTRLLFAGNILLQPAYFNKNYGNHEEYPIANQIANNSFWLGVYPGLNFEMLEFVVDSTKRFLKKL